MLFEKQELSSLWPFYFYKFMRGVFVLTTITLFIFYTQEKGITYFQASLAIAFSAFTQIIFEIITGALADTYGRKKSIVISLVFDSVIILGVALADTFWQIFVLLGLWGISTTFASGADQAWAVDSLIIDKRQHLLDSYFAKTRSFFNAGLVVAGLLSAFILTFENNTFLWYVRSALTLGVALILWVFAKEQFIGKKEMMKEGIQTSWKTAKFALGYVKKKRTLRMILYSAFFFLFGAYMAESSSLQEFQLSAGIPLEFFGIVFVVGSVLGTIAPLYGIKWASKVKNKNRYLAGVLTVFALLYVMALFVTSPYLAALLVVAYIVVDEFYTPVEAKWYNSLIPSRQRAALISVKSMIEKGGQLIGITLAGFLVDQIGGAMTIAFGGLLLIPAIIALLYIKK